jgi:hypothetical protein
MTSYSPQKSFNMLNLLNVKTFVKIKYFDLYTDNKIFLYNKKNYHVVNNMWLHIHIDFEDQKQNQTFIIIN